MGIIFNAIAISLGTLIGSIFREKIKLKNLSVLAISIMIISLVGFLENIFNIESLSLKSQDLLIVIFSLIIGASLGEFIQLDSKLSNISSTKNNGFSEIADTAIFFGVGGMQICGPVMLATTGDSSQLILKSMIDFPFAMMFGMSYGKKVALSVFPVIAGQLIIVMLTYFYKEFLDTYIIKQICAMGYIILFFSGFNLICEKHHKINNINMLAGIFIIVIYNAIRHAAL